MKFKNLISGPAPVGRILNYIKLAGLNNLKHKNGNRDLKLNNNIGSAWCTEFMVGLGLVYFEEVNLNNDIFFVKLTDSGNLLFNLIKDFNGEFDESSANLVKCKAQLWHHNVEAYNLFKNHFMKSPVFLNLYAYIKNHNIVSIIDSDFFNEYYEFFLELYTGEKYVKGTEGTSTGENRVPSLIQICSFFDFIQKDGNILIFSLPNIQNFIPFKRYDFNQSPINDAKNLIVYGTPGCGKSYYVENTLLKDYDKECYIRTTFYQDYSNTDFVGQIVPVVKEDKTVTYEFNPGPFTIALNKAIQNPNKHVALVIEELNRGNAPSIFGDIFQLLDRINGVSQYQITNVNIQKYLEEQNPNYKFEYIKLPGNFNIFATMNTSDQNVFTLDTAFKRRWEFIKIKNVFTSDHQFKNKFLPGLEINWEEFCNAINNAILNDDSFINSEDKQLGVYFISEDGLRINKEDFSTEEDRRKFAFKVFEYLWDDVAKFNRENWFKNDIKSLDQLIDIYVEKGEANKGLEVFKDDIFNTK